jgi:hypothetical protein
VLKIARLKRRSHSLAPLFLAFVSFSSSSRFVRHMPLCSLHIMNIQERPEQSNVGYKPYEYHSLYAERHQIRMLEIRYEARDALRYHIHTFDIDNCPSYAALSYTWGPPTPLFQIFIDGDRTLDIRQNLHNFLTQLSHMDVRRADEGRVRYLWIDQICIDQRYIHERNHQVGLMPTIYREANEVIIWLGKDSDTNDLPDAARWFDLQKPKYTSLSALLRNEYFRRVWIVQEVMLARDIRVFVQGYSDNWLAWEDLRSVWSEWKRGGKVRASDIPTSGPWLLDLHNGAEVQWQSLIRCISAFFGNECEDPRDKVYGLMGIVEKDERLIVDYRKPVVSVLADVVSAFCRRVQYLDCPEAREDVVFTLMCLAHSMGLAHGRMWGFYLLLETVLTASRVDNVVKVGFEAAEGEENDTPIHRWWYSCVENSGHSLSRQYFYCKIPVDPDPNVIAVLELLHQTPLGKISGE